MSLQTLLGRLALACSSRALMGEIAHVRSGSGWLTRAKEWRLQHDKIFSSDPRFRSLELTKLTTPDLSG
jgi:hypothetical protein